MFSRLVKSAANRLLVSIVGTDAALARRIKLALDASGRYEGNIVSGPIGEADVTRFRADVATLHIIEVSADEPVHLEALERHMQARAVATPVIVVSNALAENGARRFLKLGIADWLPSSCSEDALLTACDQALRPKNANGSAPHARCIAFMSAVGGSGATTLGLAATMALAGSSRDALRRSCVVDLDFQHSSLSEYADITPALQLHEVGGRVDRLDRHLLEIMLVRHDSGLAVLAAPASLDGVHTVKTEIIGRLLDLAASDFDQLVIDLPTCWQPWCEDVVRGLDAIYIVTTTTVAGLRQARKLAELVRAKCGIDMSGSVIANKSRRFGGSVSRRQAVEALGSLLGGFVSDGGDAVRRSQDYGTTLAVLGPRSRIARDMAAVVARHSKSGKASKSNAGRNRK